jgi:hypothetical protein
MEKWLVVVVKFDVPTPLICADVYVKILFDVIFVKFDSKYMYTLF